MRLLYQPIGSGSICSHFHNSSPGRQLGLNRTVPLPSAASFAFPPSQAGCPQQPHSPVCCLSRPASAELPRQAAGQQQGRPAAPAPVRAQPRSVLAAGASAGLWAARKHSHRSLPVPLQLLTVQMGLPAWGQTRMFFCETHQRGQALSIPCRELTGGGSWISLEKRKLWGSFIVAFHYLKGASKQGGKGCL